jgi:hypothetical protein
MSAEAKCCGLCGRWGNRAYRWDAEREVWVCANDRACKRRADGPRATAERRKRTIADLAQQLMDGIDGQPLYDAWTGKGWWTPQVRLTERDARIVAAWAVSAIPPGATP